MSVHSKSGSNRHNASHYTGPKYLAILIISLSLGIGHHPSLAFMGSILILYVLVSRREFFAGWRRKIGFLSLAPIGLVPIFYLLWRGASGAIGAPEDITTLPGLANHILALGFRGDLFYYVEPNELWHRITVMANVLTFQFEPWLIPFMFAGFILLLSRKRLLAAILLIAFALHLLITATYRAPQTVEYMLPAYLPLSFFGGYAIGWSYEKALWAKSSRGRSSLARIAATLLVGVFSVAVFVQLESRLPSMLSLHRSGDTRAYAQRLLDQAPNGAVILADWHWVTPLRYLQEVENQRSDIEIQFVFPTTEPYGATWARRIESELVASRDVVATHYDEVAFTGLPAAEPLGEAFLYRQEPMTEIPDSYTKLNADLGIGIQLAGWSVEPKKHRLNQEMIVNIGWRSNDDLARSAKLVARLVSLEGELVAQQDLQAIAQPSGVSVTQFRLSPYAGTPPGPVELSIGAYDEGALDSVSGNIQKKLASIFLLPAEHPPHTENSIYRPLTGGEKAATLIGYDWDFTQPDRPRLYLHWQLAEGYWSQVLDRISEYQLPPYSGPWGLEVTGSIIPATPDNYYVPLGQGIVWTGKPLEPSASPAPGEKMKTVSHFVASRPVLRDLITSVRLIGFIAGSESWAWWDLDDGVPAMGAIPTLKWIGGSYVRDPRWSTVAPTAEPGQDLAAVMRIYDSFTGRPLEILDKDIAGANPWVPMGITSVGR